LTFAVVYACPSVSFKNFKVFLIQETVNAFLLVFPEISLAICLQIKGAFKCPEKQGEDFNVVDRTKPLYTND